MVTYSVEFVVNYFSFGNLTYLTGGFRSSNIFATANNGQHYYGDDEWFSEQKFSATPSSEELHRNSPIACCMSLRQSLVFRNTKMLLYSLLSIAYGYVLQYSENYENKFCYKTAGVHS